MSRGIIYILTNDAMPGYIKIGMTSGTIEKRMKELDTTGVPLPFRCHYAVSVEDCKTKEKLIHDAFADHRRRNNREFFELAPERAVSILKALGGKEITTDNSMVGEGGVLKDEDIRNDSDKKGKKQYDFAAVGIKPGAMLEFARPLKDGTVLKCTVNDPTHKKKVSFNGVDYSLSELTRKIMKEHFGINWKQYKGPDFFKYRGEILSERKSRMLGGGE